MFRKPFRVKTSTQLKGSDRKKFRNALERCFPATVEQYAFPLNSKDEQVTQSKVVCHRGEIIQVYSINGDPVAFEYLSKWFLTVYAVWKAPTAVPALLTWENVFRKLSNGADLMAPGVVVRDENRDAYLSLSKGDVVQIRVVGCSHAVAIGIMLMDGEELVNIQKDRAAQILQMYGDYLWKKGSKTVVDFKQDLSEGEAAKDDTGADDEPELENAGGQDPSSDMAKGNGKNEVAHEKQEPTEEEKLEKALEEMKLSEDPRRAQSKMDELLKECFLSALKTSYKHIQLPILTSIFYSKYVMACAPEGQTVEVKKSSFKKVSQFLAKMQALGYIVIKEERKGVEQVTAINEELIADVRVQSEFLPKMKETSSSKEAFTYQMPEIRQTFLVTAEVLPIFKGYT
ncbi:eukaryotic translation initiation factor 2D-like [Tropilaelaps mercedesae]|uniref:Eukaryotic translation initiation factor 2D-like n=1 Tax=Tropilaelaps mercedesae TaxID=418985 RepID=A0A1V9XSY9_9ACAR|nr:eukaryotic translation initiation factor 2D-like [Tropilaelaps mercedesae]